MSPVNAMSGLTMTNWSVPCLHLRSSRWLRGIAGSARAHGPSGWRSGGMWQIFATHAASPPAYSSTSARNV